jgi:hypothetical protein
MRKVLKKKRRRRRRRVGRKRKVMRKERVSMRLRVRRARMMRRLGWLGDAWMYFGWLVHVKTRIREHESAKGKSIVLVWLGWRYQRQAWSEQRKMFV